MKKVLLLIVFALGLLYSQSWQSQVSGTGTDLLGLSFTGAYFGVACGASGAIIKTTDGGTNWSAKVSGVLVNLNAICHADANTIYIAGDGGTVLKSTDAGDNWTLLSTGSTENLFSVSFFDINYGIAVGSNTTILKTTDGGSTWNAFTFGAADNIFCVKLINADKAMAAGTSGLLLKTTDFGTNWIPLPSPTSSDIHTLAYLTTDTWIIAGQSSAVFKTENDCGSWTMCMTGPGLDFRSISFTDPNSGILTGANGIIYRSTDAGTNWTAEISGTTNTLAGVFYEDINHATAIGTGGLVLRFDGAPATPVASAATGIQTTSFTANWAAADNATGYELDVATDALFNNYVTGFQALDVANVTTYTVNTGLASGTDYWYRVRSYNISGPSSHSNSISLVTLPSVPTGLASSSITRYTYNLGWNSVTSATDYLVDIAYDSLFTSFVSGFQGLSVGNVTTFSATGLIPGYYYYSRVRAVNASGQGANCAFITTQTLHPQADLALTSSVDKPNPKNLEVLTYTFNIVNNGPDTAKSVQLLAAIPRGFKFGSAVAVNSFYNNGFELWAIPLLAPNATASLTIVDTVDYFNQAYDFRDFYEINVFALHDANFTGVNIGGKLWVGHDATIIGSNIGGQLRARPVTPNVVSVGHDLNFNSGVVHHGNVAYDGTTNLPTGQVTYPDGALVHGTGLDFTYCINYLTSISSALASYNTNGTVTNNSGTLTLTGSDIYLNVFSLSGTEFSSAPVININVPKGAAAIINVSGNSLDFGGTIYTNNNPGNFILFNYSQALTLNLTGSSFYGSILAPFATVHATGALVRGQMFANNLISVSAHQNHSFLGYVPLNRTIPFLPVVIASFSTDPNLVNNNNPATVVINTTAPYGTAGNGTWTLASVLPVNEMVISMKRYDANTILAGTNLGKLYRMNNNGILDSVINNSMTPVAYIHDIAVTDSGHILVATESGLYRTVDGGLTWLNHLPGVEVRSILTASANYLYAGTWANGLYRSNDNGYTWVQKNDNIGSTVVTSLMERNNYGTPYTVFAGTIGAGVSATFNYANSWFNTAFPYEFITSMAKTSEGIIFVGTLADGVYRSYDNGNTWAKMSGIPDGPIYAVRIDGENNIFVSSWMFGIYGSADLGDNWSYLGLGGYGISATFPGADNQLIASSAGKILINNNALTAVEPSNNSTIPAEFSLSQNYPNPFNPETIIKFTLPAADKVTLKIFNTLGKEVAVLVNSQTMNAGAHQIKFNASKLPSGVYFYRIQTSRNTVARKMLLLK